MFPLAIASAYTHWKSSCSAAPIANNIILRVFAAATIFSAIVTRISIIAVPAILVDYFATLAALTYLRLAQSKSPFPRKLFVAGSPLTAPGAARRLDTAAAKQSLLASAMQPN
jgi:hypothetical protein